MKKSTNVLIAVGIVLVIACVWWLVEMRSSSSVDTNAQPTITPAATPTPSVSGISATAVSYTDASRTFTFTHPSDLAVTAGSGAVDQSWMQNTTLAGKLLASVTIARTFEPKTNFDDAKFAVGSSADPKAVTNCLADTNGNGVGVPSTAVVINGITFKKIQSADAGAGNFYETTSYRTIHDKQCYVVEYTIHSSNIGNYSPDQGIAEFDKQKVADVLEGMAGSFTFLQR